MRIPFFVVSSSSNCGGHLASNLQHSAVQSLGWVSTPFPDFPQEIMIAFQGAVVVTTVTITSHKRFTSSRIDLSVGRVPVGRPGKVENTEFQKSCSLRFDNVPSSPFCELSSSLDMHAAGSFLRLLIQAPIPNLSNLCNQVGISALVVEGDVDMNESVRVLQSHGSPDFQMLIQGIDLEEDFLHAEAHDAGADPEAQRAVRSVQRLRDNSELREDYEEAQRMCAIIAELEDIGRRLFSLHAEKTRAVELEDYEEASRLKSEDRLLRVRLNALIRNTTTPPRPRRPQHDE